MLKTTIKIAKKAVNNVNILLVCTLLTACQTTATHPSLQNAAFQETSIVPVRQYVADWEGNGLYQISPDGQQLMWLARKGLGQGLFVKNLQTGVEQSISTRAYPQWAQDSRHILLMRDTGGDENVHIFQLDSHHLTQPERDLTPYAGSSSHIQTRLHNSADLLINNNRRDPKVFDLYHYVHATGELKLLAQNTGDVALWLTNSDGKLLGRMRKLDEKLVLEKYRPTESKNESKNPWKAVFATDYFDSVQVLDVDKNGHFVWALSNRGRDKQALVKIDTETGVEQVVYADPRVDVGSVLLNPQTQQPLIAMVEPDYQERQIFDTPLHTALEKLEKTDKLKNKHWRFQPYSVSHDGTRITGAVFWETGGKNILINTQTQEITALGELGLSRIHATSPLPQQKPIQFQSRDGLLLHGYLTLPIGTQGKNLPTVLYVHGGPWARDYWGMGDSQPLFLANRGYAVLQVNYRGSSGYGRQFQEKALGEFAAKMHDDLIDGIDHLIQKGITDSTKVAIMGGSYGGYASLVGVTFTPERFACGISFVGMSNLASLIENAPPYWELGKTWWMKYVGNPAIPQERTTMNSKSPLYRADKVRAPLLILHGANDPRVKLDQSSRMVEALQKLDKPVDFVIFQNAGHGNMKWNDNLRYYRKTEDFLSQCLGGRSNGLDWFEWGSWAF